MYTQIELPVEKKPKADPHWLVTGISMVIAFCLSLYLLQDIFTDGTSMLSIMFGMFACYFITVMGGFAIAQCIDAVITDDYRDVKETLGFFAVLFGVIGAIALIIGIFVFGAAIPLTTPTAVIFGALWIGYCVQSRR